MDEGHTRDYDYALRALNEIPDGQWRQYDPDGTVRFFALRLHEIGMVKWSPHKILYWRFLNELKKELKG